MTGGAALLQARVIENARASDDAFLLKVAYEGGERGHRYAPGEFAQLAAWPAGGEPLLRRPFSILDRGEGWASLLYQVHGRGTRILASLRPGDALSLLGPLGNRFSLPGRDGPALAVAGGVGVAPFLMLTRELVAAGREVLVLLGARTRGRLLLARELEGEGARVRVATESGDEGVKGLVTELLEEELRARGAGAIGALYVCGPEPMLKAVHAIAARERLPGEASLERRMACGFGACFTCVCRLVDPASGVARNRRTCLDGPVVRLDTLPLDRW